MTIIKANLIPSGFLSQAGQLWTAPSSTLSKNSGDLLPQMIVRVSVRLHFKLSHRPSYTFNLHMISPAHLQYVIQTKNTQAETTLNQRHEIQFGMRTLHCVASEKKKRKRALKRCSLCERRVMLQPGGLKSSSKVSLSAKRPVGFLLLLNCFTLFLASLSSSLPILLLTPSQVPFSLRFSPLTLVFEFRQNSLE